jgi:hypothetical protein
MIKILSHWVPDREIWESLHEKNAWWPTKLRDPWNTNKFVQDLKSWPGASRYFKVFDSDFSGGFPAQYLVVNTNNVAMEESQALAFFPNTLVNLINSGDIDLLVVFVHDTFTGLSFAEFRQKFYQRLEMLKITRPGSVRVLLGTRFDSVPAEHALAVKWLYYPWHPGIIQKNLINAPMLQCRTIINPASKPRRYLSLGGKNHWHRAALIRYLEQYQVSNHGIITMSHKDADDPIDFSELARHDSDFENWNQTQPQMSPQNYVSSEDLMTGIKRGLMGAQGFYQNCGWDVIQEKHHVLHSGVYLSDKVFRSMAMGVPFVINGACHSIRALRELGYQTFDGIIDESYDDETDSIKRLQMVAQQIVKISTWDRQYQEDLWPQLREIISHNHRMIMETQHLQQVHELLAS